MEFIDENYKILANAIIRAAVEDYMNAIINDDEKLLKDTKKFFNSQWFFILNNLKINSDELLKRLSNKANEFKALSKKAYEDKFISKSRDEEYRAFRCPNCGGNVYAYLRNYKNNLKAYYCKCEVCGSASKYRNTVYKFCDKLKQKRI